MDWVVEMIEEVIRNITIYGCEKSNDWVWNQKRLCVVQAASLFFFFSISRYTYNSSFINIATGFVLDPHHPNAIS